MRLYKCGNDGWFDKHKYPADKEKLMLLTVYDWGLWLNYLPWNLMKPWSMWPSLWEGSPYRTVQQKQNQHRRNFFLYSHLSNDMEGEQIFTPILTSPLPFSLCFTFLMPRSLLTSPACLAAQILCLPSLSISPAPAFTPAAPSSYFLCRLSSFVRMIDSQTFTEESCRAKNFSEKRGALGWQWSDSVWHPRKACSLWTLPHYWTLFCPFIQQTFIECLLWPGSMLGSGETKVNWAGLCNASHSLAWWNGERRGSNLHCYY